MAYREKEEDFGPLLAFRKCLDEKNSLAGGSDKQAVEQYLP